MITRNLLQHIKRDNNVIKLNSFYYTKYKIEMHAYYTQFSQELLSVSTAKPRHLWMTLLSFEASTTELTLSFCEGRDEIDERGGAKDRT